MPPTNPYQAEVNEALQLLTDAGFYTGELDGWFGPRALTALHALKNSGVVDPQIVADAQQWRITKPLIDAVVQSLNDQGAS